MFATPVWSAVGAAAAEWTFISTRTEIENTRRLRRNELARLRRAAAAAAAAAFRALQVDGIPDEVAERQRILRNQVDRVRYAAASALQHQAEEVDDHVAERNAAATEASRGLNRLRVSAEYSRRRRRAFMEVRQQWDHAHPCRYCGRVWLVSSSAGLRKKCCLSEWQDVRSWALSLLIAAPAHCTRNRIFQWELSEYE